jgi:hypothetical protein
MVTIGNKTYERVVKDGPIVAGITDCTELKEIMDLEEFGRSHVTKKDRYGITYRLEPKLPRRIVAGRDIMGWVPDPEGIENITYFIKPLLELFRSMKKSKRSYHVNSPAVS